MRNGLAPVTKNVRNVRFKKEQNEDPKQVEGVEKILKDIIDYGFADNVEEEMLEFNDEGELDKKVRGSKEKPPTHSNLIQI